MLNELKNLSVDYDIMLLENARYFDIQSLNMVYTEKKSALEKAAKSVNDFLQKLMKIITNFVMEIVAKFKRAVVSTSIKLKLSELKKQYVSHKAEFDSAVLDKKITIFDQLRYKREITKVVDTATKIMVKYEYEGINNMKFETIMKSIEKDSKLIEDMVIKSFEGDKSITAQCLNPAKGFAEILSAASIANDSTEDTVNDLKKRFDDVCEKAIKSATKAENDMDYTKVYNHSQYRGLVNKYGKLVKKAMYNIAYYGTMAISEFENVAALSSSMRFGKQLAYNSGNIKKGNVIKGVGSIATHTTISSLAKHANSELKEHKKELTGNI